MKTTVWRSVILLALGLGTALGAFAAYAQEFPQTSAAAQMSIARGFKQPSLPLLRRVGAGEPDTVSASLVEKLCPSPCSPPRTRNPGNMLQVTGSSWSLQILGDGTAARFQDLEVAKRAHSQAKDVSQKISAPALERAGRAFIAAKLASVIVLGPEEELVPVRVDYRVEGIQNVKTRDTTRSVVANRIVFGRTIRGVPIVGGGSTVVLTFANDDSLESFQYDWPKYQMANSRSVVNIEEIMQRMQRVIGFRMGVPTSTFLAKVPPGAVPTSGIEIARNTQLQSLECGYYDPGFSARDASASVQPGCVYHVVTKSEDGIRSAFSGAVPAAAQVEPDATWREVDTLRGASPGAKPIVPASSRPQ
jgi:hypothetical protein